jgi:adenylate kinase
MAQPVIFIYGPPGAGKGTQSDILAKRLKAVHLSSGEIMRRSGDQALVDRLAHGLYAKSEDFLKYAEKAIREIPEDTMIILDGVARMLPETKWLNELLPSLGRAIECVLYLDVHKEEAVSRNLKRGRADDDASLQDRRWHLFHTEMLPVVNYYKDKGLLKEVDGVGTIEEVAGRIQKVLGQ